MLGLIWFRIYGGGGTFSSPQVIQSQKSPACLGVQSDPHPSKKICFIYLNESPLKMVKNAFYFILKALFVLKIFKFLS